MVVDRVLGFQVQKLSPSCTLYKVVLLVKMERWWWSDRVECVIDPGT